MRRGLLLRRCLRSHDHFACHAGHELGQGRKLFSVAFRHLLKEIPVGRYNLMAGAALGETLDQRTVLLQPMPDERLPLTSERAQALMGQSVGVQSRCQKRVPRAESQRANLTHIGDITTGTAASNIRPTEHCCAPLYTLLTKEHDLRCARTGLPIGVIP